MQICTFTGLYKYPDFKKSDGPVTYPWKTIIQADREANVPVYLQIVNAIIQEIHHGRLIPGQQLPGSRALSDLLAVNRKTVVIAYDELQAQGWVEVLPSKGAFVTESLPIPQYQPLDAHPTGLSRLQEKTTKTLESEATTASSGKPFLSGYINVDGGVPDDRLAPLGSLYKRCRSLAVDSWGRKYRVYGQVEGEHALRKALPGYLSSTRGLRCSVNNVFVTRGSSMAIFLAFSALLQPGDGVIVGDTDYEEACEAAQYVGGELIPVPVDDKGLSLTAIEKACQDNAVKAVYITPHHHYPTTVTLSAERRIGLLALADQYGFTIIEDDYDYDFHYKSGPILPLASLDTKGIVIYLGGFSKLLAPVVRVGYMVSPSWLMPELNKIRKVIDRQGDPIMEKAIADMIADGELQRHLKKALKAYQLRRDLFCNQLREKLGNWVTFQVPDGGMAVWIKFHHQVPLTEVMDKAFESGVYIRIDNAFIKSHNALRVGFASLSPEEITQVTDVLAACVFACTNT